MLDAILSLSNGARFYRVDLHNHTPADPGFHCLDYNLTTEAEKMAFAREYVRYAREEKGLDIIGITDHNDTSWLGYIQEAAAGTDLIVLPGVELGANEGKRQVHYLGLFNPGTDPLSIDHFISSLGLLPGNRFSGVTRSPRLTQLTCRELTHRICHPDDGLPGLAIAAHATRKNGLLHELEGEGRVLAYEDRNLIALEIPETRAALSKFVRRLVDGDAEHYSHKAVACLNSSDGRGIGRVNGKDRHSVGDRATRIKLSHVSIEALRHAFIDHDSRIRLDGEYAEARYPRLIGVAIERGFLCQRTNEGQAGPFLLHFNPNLNAIIGGRGTGKSSLLEAIRYVFDLKPRTSAAAAQHQQVVDVTLKGAIVRAYYESADGARYEILRRAGRLPEVRDVASGERMALKPEALLPGGVPLEVYGQKEIYEIANDVTFQLNLIDTYISEALRDVLREENELVRQIENNAQELIHLEDEIAEGEQLLLERPVVDLELSRLEADSGLEALEHKKRLEIERRQLVTLERAFEAQLALLSNYLPSEAPDSIRAEDFPELVHQLAKIEDHIRDVVTAAQREIMTLWAETESHRDRWYRVYEENEVAYATLLDKHGDAISFERFFALKARQADLIQVALEQDQRLERRATLSELRIQLLNRLRELRKEKLSGLRTQKAADLTTALEGAVQVELHEQGNRDRYAVDLLELFNRRQKKGLTKKVIEGIAAVDADPIELAAAIRKEREKPGAAKTPLSKVFGVSKAYRMRLAQLDDATLYELELYRIPDRPNISLRVGDHYRSLTPPLGEPGLSMGQKCTAVLSIVLVERQTPLIIDQPEDDLDNAFIFREIVQTLRREKERRQFVVATHNANIPVSGDAEQILLMRADENNGWIAFNGSIDDPEIRGPVENILEGGREAFSLRQKKYAI